MAQSHGASVGTSMASGSGYAGNTSSTTSSYNNERGTSSSLQHEDYAGKGSASPVNIQTKAFSWSLGGGSGGGYSGYNSSGFAAAFISGSGRYNYGARHSFAYYSTPYSRDKSRLHDYTNDYYFSDRNYQSFFFDPDYMLFYTCDFIYEDLIANYETTHTTDNVLNYSFDGFVAYGKDTVSGIVTITNSSIYLEHTTDGKHENVYTFSYGDSKLKTVAVFDGYKELYLSRATPDGKLLRVLHAGKLTIYDDHYSFISPTNIDKTKITIVYNGKVKSPVSYLASDSKKLLVEAANSVYGLNIKAQNYTWNKLFTYICSLD